MITEDSSKFLWYKNGNLKNPLVHYDINMHVFGHNHPGAGIMLGRKHHTITKKLSERKHQALHIKNSISMSY